MASATAQPRRVVTLGEIVGRFGGQLRGDADRVIDGLGTLASAVPTGLTFLANPKYRHQLASTRAAAVIVAPEFAADCPVAAILTDQPYLYYARVAAWLYPPPVAEVGVHASAVVASPVPESVSVGPQVVIGREVRLGENVVIGASCVLGDGVEIGDDSRLYPNVTIYHGCRLGRRVIVHAGAVIGSDGFGLARDEQGHWQKIAQIGGVCIGDDVEIGANTTIDRGALEDTVIEEGVKLDNQIQVAHNVVIGAHSAIAGCVGIAGSARIGRRCTIGGAGMILGHLSLADDVHVSAGTLVGKSIAQPGTYTGAVPFLEHGSWLRNFAHLRGLSVLADRIRTLETRLDELAGSNDAAQPSAATEHS